MVLQHASYDLEFDINDSYQLLGGLDYKEFTFRQNWQARRDTSACNLVNMC